MDLGTWDLDLGTLTLTLTLGLSLYLSLYLSESYDPHGVRVADDAAVDDDVMNVGLRHRPIGFSLLHSHPLLLVVISLLVALGNGHLHRFGIILRHIKHGLQEVIFVSVVHSVVIAENLDTRNLCSLKIWKQRLKLVIVW